MLFLLMNIIAWSNCFKKRFLHQSLCLVFQLLLQAFLVLLLYLLFLPEAFTFSPYGDTVSNISLTSSALAPTPPFTKPVDVFTKLAFASMHNSQAFFISSFVNRSVSKITLSGLSLQAVFTVFYIIYYEIVVFIF